MKSLSKAFNSSIVLPRESIDLRCKLMLKQCLEADKSVAVKQLIQHKLNIKTSELNKRDFTIWARSALVLHRQLFGFNVG